MSGSVSEARGDWESGRAQLLQRCKKRALLCLHEREYGRAFAHFLVALTMQPEVCGELLNVFIFTLEKLVEKLEAENQINEIIMCYEQALEVLPQDSHVLHGLATTLFRFGYVECALSYFLKSYEANPFFSPSLYCMENLKNALVERWHFVMLNDRDRNRVYRQAIEKAVREGGHRRVLDVGAGTGLLSMMASDANADKVYACESSEIMFSVLQNVVELNEKPVTCFQKLSTDLCVGEDLPEKVTLVVTEIFDAGLFGESSLETLRHAWEHLLQAEEECEAARVIPRGADVFVVPVECEMIRKSFRLNDKVKKFLQVDDVLPLYLDEEPYSSERICDLPGDYTFLSAPISILQANFNSLKDIKRLLEGRTLTPSFPCTKKGQLDAFIMWFHLHLDDEISLSTNPEYNSCWEQAVFYAFPQLMEGSRTDCNVGDTIEPVFLCQGHLQLKKINISNGCSPQKVEEEVLSDIPCRRLSMEPSLIYLLNAAAPDLVRLDLGAEMCDNASVLDLSTFPLLGLQCLQRGRSVHVLQSPYQREVEQLRDGFGAATASPGRLQFRSYEEFCRSKMQCDFLIVDPVEVGGLLKKNLLEDVMMLRMQCLKDTGTVIPGELEIHAVLVESDILNGYSKLVADDRVCGYKISQVMNAYKCQIHQDLHFSRLPHTKLSKPFRLCHINLNDKVEKGAKSFFCDLPKYAEVESTADGRVMAIVYWFCLRYRSDLVVDTSRPGSLWRQAAFVLDEGVAVRAGGKVKVQYSLKNSCFQIGILSAS